MCILKISVSKMRLQVSCVVVLIKPLGNRIEDKYKMEIISSFSTYISYIPFYSRSRLVCVRTKQ